jgi:hypothetical protein
MSYSWFEGHGIPGSSSFQVCQKCCVLELCLCVRNSLKCEKFRLLLKFACSVSAAALEGDRLQINVVHILLKESS